MLRNRPDAERLDDAEFWEELLAARPDVLHRLLADIYRATYGVERPPSLEALWDLFDTPEFAADPFPQAATALLKRRGRSMRWLAMQTHVPHQVLSRYLAGQRPIINVHDVPGAMQRMEAVAKALAVHPSYFSEWRRLWIMSLLDRAFTTRPDLAADLFRRFSGFAPRSNGRSHEEETR